VGFVSLSEVSACCDVFRDRWKARCLELLVVRIRSALKVGLNLLFLLNDLKISSCPEKEHDFLTWTKRFPFFFTVPYLIALKVGSNFFC
jgi:hypothetical protein